MTVVFDRSEEVVRSMRDLARAQVLVGFPEKTTNRPAEADGITNAALAYIHENGAPESGIPARPFLVPGIESAKEPIEKRLRNSANMALAGKPDKMVAALFLAGLEAQSAVRAKITEGPFEPLAPATLRARAKAARRKGHGVTFKRSDFRPLIDTGQMRQAVNFVINKLSQPRKG